MIIYLVFDGLTCCYLYISACEWVAKKITQPCSSKSSDEDDSTGKTPSSSNQSQTRRDEDKLYKQLENDNCNNRTGGG